MRRFTAGAGTEAMGDTRSITHCYVAYCAACGGWTDVVVDDAAIAREVGRYTARAIRRGCRVERVEIEAFRQDQRVCGCQRKRRRRRDA